MRNWLKELGRNFQSGVEKASGKQESDIQLDLLTQRLSDISVSDEVMVQEVFGFLSKFPQQRDTQNFGAILNRIMEQRPGTIEMIQKKLK